MSGGRTIDAALQLLDRQILDKDGEMAGKVDDLELTVPEDGSAPIVTAILAGPGALAPRVAGSLGAWIRSFRRRMAPSESKDMGRISFGVVKVVNNHVEITVSRHELDVDRSERWALRVISRIPGSEHEPEGG